MIYHLLLSGLAHVGDAPLPSNALGRFGTPEEDIAPVILFLATTRRKHPGVGEIGEVNAEA
ncbi:hypothetical protein [Mesorhizobium sp.]|uniref:hypothetical protein n=1 Tax=Mesorhizobium sp. TaxID=1871066 RepID=UPI000FE5CC0C|nr:hypothetical protein [Mesorhizobium sp.]RWK44236.1 MAG: hypothetical protein EOR46_02710 [Mesorhizobium sp.]RWK70733.1 MAG: hypothetical protein EOR54_04225 [Mesorhizobium sp.]RWK81310.1 MAG: hypothetical protein EOR50_02710 [Mesorhizobium sp.]RWK84993.1 MAG: hypothetical protein EOR51_00900 [Mesorhizobium sp.]RWL04255.1 MAG: hypothetical protein EOR55_15990 [Mesorhizobium sp.]